jgi:transglutaminase-like putative cysteine protease
VDRPIPDPASIDRLVLSINNVPEGVTIIASDSQEVVGPREDISYLVTARRVNPSLLISPPYGGFPAELEPYLLPSLFIESDDRRMLSRVDKITEGGTTPTEDAEVIMEWVFENVTKKMVDATSALDALSSLEGECQAHAHLFAALARARGIPTKVVSGIVYSEEIGGFLFHSWNEVYVGAWVPIDATFGQFPADVTHIAFSEGEGSSMIDIIPLIGAISIEVVDRGGGG